MLTHFFSLGAEGWEEMMGVEGWGEMMGVEGWRGGGRGAYKQTLW